MPDRYADLIAQLAQARAAQADEQAEVDAWFEAQCAAAREAVVRADQQVAAAGNAVATAQGNVDFTDAEAGRLWQLLAVRMRVANPARLGPPPELDQAPDGPEEAATREHPGRLLDHARELLDEVRPARGYRPAVRVLGVLFLLALLAAAAVALTQLR
jgi:hypothetical protein